MLEKISKHTWKSQTDCERTCKKAIKLRKKILLAWLTWKSSEQAELYRKARRTLALIDQIQNSAAVGGVQETSVRTRRFYKLISKSDRKELFERP